MPAIAIAAQVENNIGTRSPLLFSSVRITRAVRRVCPEFRMPESSLSSFIHVSASSQSSVGRHPSIALKTEATVALLTGSPRITTASSTSSNVVLPHCLVGDVMVSFGHNRQVSIR